MVVVGFACLDRYMQVEVHFPFCYSYMDKYIKYNLTVDISPDSCGQVFFQLLQLLSLTVIKIVSRSTSCKTQTGKESKEDQKHEAQLCLLGFLRKKSGGGSEKKKGENI